MFAMDFAEFLINQASISRFTLVNAADGGSQKSYSPVNGLQGLACQISAVSGSSYNMASKLQMDVSHQVIFGQVYPLQNGDLLNDGTNNYQVQWFGDPAGTGEVFMAYLNLIRN